MFSLQKLSLYLALSLLVLVTIVVNGLAPTTKASQKRLVAVVMSDRREFITQLSKGTLTATVATSFPQPAHSKSSNGDNNGNDDVEEALVQARTTLQKLVDNWSTAIFDCTYADVPRDLLKTENKELLLEKAKTSALFDKSASIVSCKTVNNKVRDYIGVTGKGPVSVLPKVFQEGLLQVMDSDIGDNVDLYVQTKEEIEQALSKANSLSYEARRDYTSMNNFEESQKEKILADTTSNLSQAKAAIESAIAGLDVLIKLIKK